MIAEACAILVLPRSFRRSTTWTLFWSLTEASTRFADRGRTASREPELNGTLMTLVASAIEAFPASQGADVAMVVGDHATLGNGARSGADFGLILEVEHGSTVRHLTVLLQAKRAPQRRVDVRRAGGTSTQLDRLVNSGGGSYVFYHAHEDPAGLGTTLRYAGAISGSNPVSIEVLSPASDFAARMAAAADQLFVTSPTHALPGYGVPNGRGAALRMLFNPARPGMRLNDVVIARAVDDAPSPREIAAFRSEWSHLVERHRRGVESSAQHAGPLRIGSRR